MKKQEKNTTQQSIFSRLGIDEEAMKMTMEKERIQMEEERARFIRDLGFEIAKRLKEEKIIGSYIG